MLDPQSPETTLAEERSLILRHEPDPARRKKLLASAILVALSTKLLDTEWVWTVLQEEGMSLLEDPVVSKWLQDKLTAEVMDRLAKAEAKIAKAEANIAQSQAELARVKAEAAQAEAEARRQAEAKAVKAQEQ